MSILAGPAKGTYGYNDLQGLWIDAGGNPAYAPMAAAVALAESSGRTQAISSTGDYGLWQINAQAHPAYDPGQLLSPYYNAKAAVAVSNGGTNFRPWCTAWSDNACGTKGGTYLGFGSSALAKLQGDYTPPGGPNVTNAGTPGASTPTGALAPPPGAQKAPECQFKVKLPSPLHDFCADGMLGVLTMAAGGVLVLAGVVLLVRQTGPLAKVAKALSGLPGVGAAAGAVSSRGEAPESSANRRAHQARVRQTRLEARESEREGARRAVMRERESGRQRRFEDAYDAGERRKADRGGR